MPAYFIATAHSMIIDMLDSRGVWLSREFTRECPETSIKCSISLFFCIIGGAKVSFSARDLSVFRNSGVVRYSGAVE